MTPTRSIDPATNRPLPPGVTFRGDKQYQGRLQIKGKRLRRTFPSAALAKRWMAETSAKATLGQFVDTRALERMTLGSLVQRYRDECMGHRSADRAGHMPPLLGDTDLCRTRMSDWAPAVVRGYRDRLVAAGFAPATVVKRLNMLAAVIRHAISEWDLAVPNHASGRVVKRPKGADRKRTRRLSDDENEAGLTEYDRLLAAMAQSPCADDIWMVRWAVEQATRLGEAVRLTWGDIDFKRRSIALSQTKTDAAREELGPEIRPLAPGAIRLLQERLAAMPSPPEPHDRVFRVGGDKAFGMRYCRLVRAAGLEDLTFHDLRHEATSRLARLLNNPLDLKRVTGHRDVRSLDRYYQPVPATISHKLERAELELEGTAGS